MVLAFALDDSKTYKFGYLGLINILPCYKISTNML